MGPQCCGPFRFLWETDMVSDDARPVLIVFADVASRRCGAGWYGTLDAPRARGRATQLGLAMITDLSEELRTFAATLPRGGFSPDGTLALDLVDREVIDRLLALRPGTQPDQRTGKVSGVETPAAISQSLAAGTSTAPKGRGPTPPL